MGRAKAGQVARDSRDAAAGWSQGGAPPNRSAPGQWRFAGAAPGTTLTRRRDGQAVSRTGSSAYRMDPRRKRAKSETVTSPSASGNGLFSPSLLASSTNVTPRRGTEITNEE